jgi:hypothetical protein
MAPKPGRDRDPGVARRLHDDGDVAGLDILGQHRPQSVEISGGGAEASTDPQETSHFICKTRLVRSTTRDIDAQT